MKKIDKASLKKKDKYRLRNWAEYNQSLVNRGSITFWFDKESIQNWYSCKRTGNPGRPLTYADNAIKCGLTIKTLFRIPLRQTQGLVQSIIKILGIDLHCPHYSVFCRRAKELDIPIRPFLKSGEKLNVIFDSTGLKVFGEGEWKVRKHGYSKRRTWRKVHVGICAETGQIIVSALSTNSVTDDQAMVQMMTLLDGVDLGDIIGDGAYDTIDCRETIYFLYGNPVIPPQKKARRHRALCQDERNKAIDRIKELGESGRELWKKEINYHRRSRVETHMFRQKTILGDRLSARTWDRQVTEMQIRNHILNKMLELGRAKSYKVVV